MPTSHPCSVTAIITEIFRLRPRSVLDLGIGFGKYGVLCREYLDIWEGRVTRDQWQTRIVGVEGFSRYRNPAWELYDEIKIEDFSIHYESFKGFDLVLLLDSLEHVDKTVGLKLLSTLRSNNKVVIVCVPEVFHPQEAAYGNEFERHRAAWTAEEMAGLGGRVFFAERIQSEITCAIFGD